MAGNSQKVHREKRAVEENVSQHEMNLAEPLVHHAAKHFGKPIVNRRKQRENNPGHHVVEMGDDVIGVMNENIHRRRSHENTAQTADQKVRDKSQSKQHRRCEPYISAPEGPEPIKDFDRRWNGDDHRRHHEGRPEQRIHAAHEHVMTPNDPGEKRNRDHRKCHRVIAENRFA